MRGRERGTFRRTGWVAALACLLAGSVAAGAAASAAAASAAAVHTTTLSSEKVKPGKVVDVGNRRAVYMFTKDSSSKSSCNGSCATTWQPLLSLGTVSVAGGSGLNARMLGKLKRSNGQFQITYNHHPLYVFSQDKKAGDIKGEGANLNGGHWYLVGPGGSAVKPKSSACNPLCQSY